jgi:hypothetical protein
LALALLEYFKGINWRGDKRKNMKKCWILMANLACAALFPLSTNANDIVVQDIWPAGPNSTEMNLYADQPGAAPGIMEYLYGDDFTRLDDSSVIEWTGTSGTIGITDVYAGASQNLYTAGLSGSPTSFVMNYAGMYGGTPTRFDDFATFTPVTNPFLFLDIANGNNGYSNPALNGGTVRMVAFQVTAYLDTPGDISGGYTDFSDPTYVIAFEDGTDMDYNDLVVEVSGVAPVPDGGATVNLLGLSLCGCGLWVRKMKKVA